MGFHHDNDGVGAGSDTFQLEFIQALSPGNKFQVFSVDYIDTGRLQTLLIFVILQCKMEEIFKDRPEPSHHSNLDGTNADDLQLYISMSDINFNQELGLFKFSHIWKLQYALLGHYV